MRNLFLWILSILIIFSQYIIYKNEKVRIDVTGAPVIYWVTDANPARATQIRLFRAWLSNHNYPDIDVRLDTANQGLQKTIVQAVTGVAGDVIDMYSGAVGFLQEMGVLEDMSRVDRDFGYRDKDIYEPTRDETFVDGKHYGFPCNIGLTGLVVNRNIFSKNGLPFPPRRWDFQTFESAGRLFTATANRGKKRQEIFFLDGFSIEIMRRSVGVSLFNETYTKPVVDQKAYTDILERAYRWTYEDHLVPTAAEKLSVAIEQGYGGFSFQLFMREQFAMIQTGRWGLIPLRDWKCKFILDAVEHPHGGFPNAVALSRSVVVYAGSKHKDLAAYFCAFLRSPDYNLNIVEDADGNTPETPYLNTEAFLRPVGFTNEWLMHQGLAHIATNIALGRELSPYANAAVYYRLEDRHLSGFMAGVKNSRETTKVLQKELQDAMDQYLKKNPQKKAVFDQALLRQKKIDEAKAKGKKIPLDLVDNTLLKSYYRTMGLGE